MTPNPIAIIGLGAVFPGAFHPTRFWENILQQTSQVSTVPAHRWISGPEWMVADSDQPDRARHARACLVQDIDFNPQGFDIEPQYLTDLDPLYHLVLEAGRQALSEYSPSPAERARTGVILAAIALPTDASSRLARQVLGEALALHLKRESHATGRPGTGLPETLAPVTASAARAAHVTGLPAALLARALNLGGGTFTLDAACASSVYAIKLACDALRRGQSDLMLAGGVSRPDCLYTQVGFSQLQALSRSGRCAPFDRRADGLVVGEGAGLLVLKRLADAQRDHNRIYGVIRGIGLSNDRRGALLAPDQEGQYRAMQAAYTAAGWQPEDVDLIECHGAGTPLGDATELASLHQLWQGRPWQPAQCPLGSVKSNIGHLLTAAGVAGMIKLLLAMQHQTLPPSLNFSQPPENSPLSGGPFRVQTHPAPWLRRGAQIPRRAALSAFGFGGINGHLLLEEWCAEDEPEKTVFSSELRQRDSAEAQLTDKVAIVGLAAGVGALENLAAFREAVFTGQGIVGQRPAARWKGVAPEVLEALGGPDLLNLHGAFLEQIAFVPGELRLPPNEIPDILPQHLLMLKTVRQAMQDARVHDSDQHEAGLTTGVLIALDFDYEATDYHLRWQVPRQVQNWQAQSDLSLEPQDLERLRDTFGPPLTAARTQGALSSLIASRVAREFKCGGPCFTLSGDAPSGLQAVELAVGWLQEGLVERMIVGAVDLPGDLRPVLLKHALAPYTAEGNPAPFDQAGRGRVSAEGAGALILKRLTRARQDGDHIYAIIDGCGAAHGGGIDIPRPTVAAYLRSWEQARQAAAITSRQVGYFEAHGSGDPAEDALESEALARIFGPDICGPGTCGPDTYEPDRYGAGQKHVDDDPASADFRAPFLSTNTCPCSKKGGHERTQQSAPAEQPPPPTCALGTLKGLCGHAGAAAGLLSLIKAALSLDQTLLPPLPGDTVPTSQVWQDSALHIPQRPQFWVHSSHQGLRRAAVAALAGDGNCRHVILSEAPPDPRTVTAGPQTAPVFRFPALLGIDGADAPELLSRLQILQSMLAAGDCNPWQLARLWQERYPLNAASPRAGAIWGTSREALQAALERLHEAVQAEHSLADRGTAGAAYTPCPLGIDGQVALVYPGSGNHYVGLGRELGLHWPHLLRQLETETPYSREQLLPHRFMPWRLSWEKGWEAQALAELNQHARDLIFGQVLYGVLMTRLLLHLKIVPQAALGYSLGESAALLALGIWRDREEMRRRLATSSLFTTDLAGPCQALRQAWGLSAFESASEAEGAAGIWQVLLLNRAADEVRPVLTRYPATRLLIVNTPEECVIGGLPAQVAAVVQELRCESLPLPGVVSVHCDALTPVKEAYWQLHHLPVTPSPVRVYSSAWGRAYPPAAPRCADALTDQALYGFDFNAVIRRAWQDGVRLFLETGPQGSCTRMIRQILKDVPHCSLSFSSKEDGHAVTLVRNLAVLISERVAVDLQALQPEAGVTGGATTDDGLRIENRTPKDATAGIIRKVGLPLALPNAAELQWKRAEGAFPQNEVPQAQPQTPDERSESSLELLETTRTPGVPASLSASQSLTRHLLHQQQHLLREWRQTQTRTAGAHQDFLSLTQNHQQVLMAHLLSQARLLAAVPQARTGVPASETPASQTSAFTLSPFAARPPVEVLFTREQCLEFARGRAASVLGPEFEALDRYKVRVRLPDEPLMLVDRILKIEGPKGTPGPGRIVTEHDVLPRAWYLDGGRAPVCISVEAGQADLFLSAWLGIDLMVQGQRAYRLLDAAVTFHRDLPRPGETIRYDIRIERFVRQGATWMFFFHFDGTIEGTPLITMRKGCAGFFTPEEVAASGGIIQTSEEMQSQPGQRPADWQPLVEFEHQDVTRVEPAGVMPAPVLNALREGDLERAFGSAFAGIQLTPALRLPGGRMKLIHRIVELNPSGGRFGLGRIVAEADVAPDDWFLTCHFVDDKVMPGTLMYECCAHTLRVLLQRLGWVWPRPGVHYAPVIGVQSVLKCRGPVTPSTRCVRYEIDLQTLGYQPEPFALAEALMVADGHPIVAFKNLSLRMVGLTRQQLEQFWIARQTSSQAPSTISSPPATATAPAPPVLYTAEQILAFAVGQPSRAFGEPYRIFDNQRRIARLPGPPYLFLDRILAVDHPAWHLAPGGWAHAQYDLTPQAWFFKADRSGHMPYCVLLEIPLQLCGWLAAYAGSALKSEKDLKFRNLGGEATIYQNLYPPEQVQVLDIQARLTKVAVAGDSMIETFDFRLLHDQQPVFEGQTTFGFFTAQALAQQVGLRQTAESIWQPSAPDQRTPHPLPPLEPLTPRQAFETPYTEPSGLQLPGRALCLLDGIAAYLPHGGPQGLGYLKGYKQVDPQEWFFKAHFYQDPVCPGSLGLESFLQLLKYFALQRWPELTATHRFSLVSGFPQQWSYRGQIIPSHQHIEVEAFIQQIEIAPEPGGEVLILADGLLQVDGLYIYKMEQYGLRLVPEWR